MDLVSKIKRVENQFHLEKLLHINQHGLQTFQPKISKRNQQRQAFLQGKSVSLIIQKAANVFTKFNASQINKELKRTEFDDACWKNVRLIDGFSLFFRLTQKIGSENDSSKERWRHLTSKIIKFRQNYSKGHLANHCAFYYLTWRVNLRAL